MSRWPIRSLSELVDFIGGGTPSRDRSDYWGGHIPWASVKDLQGPSLDHTVETITDEGLANSASNLVPAGVVIVATRVGLGKVAINSLAVAINQDLKALRPKANNILPRYLLFFLVSKAEALENAGVGATVKGLTIAEFGKLEVPVPPLAEQERLVRILDEADALRKLRAQADQRTATLIPALFHKMFGDPTTNLLEFPLRPIGELIRVKSGDGLTAEQMDTNGPFAVYGGNGVNGRHSEFMFEEPVIVIGRVGVYCGAVHLAEPKSWVTDNALYVAETYAELDRTYLAEALRHAGLNQYAGRAAQPLVSANRIYPVPILLPPLRLQREFAVRVAEVRAMEAAQAESRQRLDALFQSLLYRAFADEL